VKKINPKNALLKILLVSNITIFLLLLSAYCISHSGLCWVALKSTTLVFLMNICVVLCS